MLQTGRWPSQNSEHSQPKAEGYKCCTVIVNMWTSSPFSIPTADFFYRLGYAFMIMILGLLAVYMKSSILRDITPCSPLKNQPTFRHNISLPSSWLRFGGHLAVIMKSSILRDITPCSPLKNQPTFRHNIASIIMITIWGHLAVVMKSSILRDITSCSPLKNQPTFRHNISLLSSWLKGKRSNKAAEADRQNTTPRNLPFTFSRWQRCIAEDATLHAFVSLP
jgi:hypothetical protein